MQYIRLYVNTRMTYYMPTLLTQVNDFSNSFWRLVLLCHFPHRLGVSLKLLFRIGGIDRRLSFVVADFHLPDHLVNSDIASR